MERNEGGRYKEGRRSKQEELKKGTQRNLNLKTVN